MRDKNYKVYTYRLAEEIAKEIKELKQTKNISYNLLFLELINKHHEKKKE